MNAYPAEALARRCRETVERLESLYDWNLAADQRDELVQALADGAAEEESERGLQQSCCRLRFASLFRDLHSGGAPAEAALSELLALTWVETEDGQEVRYHGYLYRSALAALRRQAARHGSIIADMQQVAADAAGRALTTVRDRFRDCRDEDAFWGWTARVAERAAIDELRSGRVTGGSSVRAASLDAMLAEPSGSAAGVHDQEERHVDALAVREELLRKCRLGKLSEDQREALVRSFWGGEKPREIADALSAERGSTVSAAQVSLWKHRGLQIMEANLREQGFA